MGDIYTILVTWPVIVFYVVGHMTYEWNVDHIST